MSHSKDNQYRLLERHEFAAQCRLRTTGSLARISIVRNLTSDGCAVECIPANLQRGDTIYLQFGSVGPVEGRVMWLRKGMEAGIRFEQALHPAVFDRLLYLAHRNMVLSNDPMELKDDAVALRKTGHRMAAC